MLDKMDLGSHLHGLTARLLPAPASRDDGEGRPAPRARPTPAETGGVAGLCLFGTAAALALPATASASALYLRRAGLVRLGTELTFRAAAIHRAAQGLPQDTCVTQLGSALAELCMCAAAITASGGSPAMLGACSLMCAPSVGLLLFGCGRDDAAARRLSRLPAAILRDGLLGQPEALLRRCAAAAAASGKQRTRVVAADLAIALHALICAPRLAVAVLLGAGVAVGAAIGGGVAAA